MPSPCHLQSPAASPAIRTWFNAPLAVKCVASVRACYAPSMHEKLGRWSGWDGRWEYWCSLQLGWRREDGLHFNSWDNSFCVDPCQVSWCLHVAVIWLVHCRNSKLLFGDCMEHSGICQGGRRKQHSCGIFAVPSTCPSEKCRLRDHFANLELYQ